MVNEERRARIDGMLREIEALEIELWKLKAVIAQFVTRLDDLENK